MRLICPYILARESTYGYRIELPKGQYTPKHKDMTFKAFPIFGTLRVSAHMDEHLRRIGDYDSLARFSLQIPYSQESHTQFTATVFWVILGNNKQ